MGNVYDNNLRGRIAGLRRLYCHYIESSIFPSQDSRLNFLNGLPPTKELISQEIMRLEKVRDTQDYQITSK